MDIVIRFKSGTIRRIVDALSIEVDKNKLTCLCSTEYHSVSLNTVCNIRIVNGPELHELFYYLDKCDDGELSDDALSGHLENEVVGWNIKKNATLNPGNTIKAYFEWAGAR